MEIIKCVGANERVHGSYMSVYLSVCVCRWENVSLCFSSGRSMSRECIVYESWRIPCCYHSDYDESFEIKSIRFGALLSHTHTTHAHSQTCTETVTHSNGWYACILTTSRRMCVRACTILLCFYITPLAYAMPYAYTHLISIDEMFSICYHLNSTKPVLCVLVFVQTRGNFWSHENHIYEIYTFTAVWLCVSWMPGDCHIVSNSQHTSMHVSVHSYTEHGWINTICCLMYLPIFQPLSLPAYYTIIMSASWFFWNSSVRVFFLFCVGWGVCVYCVVKRRYNFYGIKMFCVYIHISRGLQEPPPSHQYHIYAYHEKWEKCNETTWKVLLEQLLKLLAYVCKLNTMGHVHMKTFRYYEIC